MNILFVRPQAELGGVSRSMLSLANSLIERGHKVTLGTSGGEWAHRFPWTVPFALHPSSPLNLIWSVWQMVRFVRQESIDLIHSHHRFSTLVSRVVAQLTNVPLVCTVHEFKTDWQPLATLWLAPIVCVPSRALQGHLVRFYKVAPECVTVIPPGISPVLPEAAVVRMQKALGAVPLGPVIGYVGRLVPEKGPAILLRSLPSVFRAHPKARAVMVGNGAEQRSLEALAQSLGVADRIGFMGAQEDAQSLMTAMDVIVTPSLTESFGLTIAEAMAAGRPVVASEVGGVAEIVDEGLTGFLVPPNDPESLARRIIDVLSDAQRAAAMGAAGRQKAAQWNPARVAELTEAVYHRATGAGRDR